MRSAERRFTPASRVPLSPLTTLGVGGPARWFARAETVDDVAAAHRWCLDRDVPLFVLGGGSNVVIADAGVEALVLHVALRGIESRRDGADAVITAAAGEPWDAFVGETVTRGLAGLECLSGIPGSVGGTPIQNVGAYGQEVADTIVAVTALDRRTGEHVTMNATDCAFDYRMSRFKRTDPERYIVCDVAFRLRRGDPTVTYPDVIGELERRHLSSPGLDHVRDAVLTIRKRKGMVLDPEDDDTRSVGSFFMNPVVDVATHARIAAAHDVVPAFVRTDGQVKIPAAWLIEHAGYGRGHAAGAVGLSTKHPLAIVNRGGATARDVLELAAAIKRRVADRFGIELRPEPIFVGLDADRTVAYLRHGRT